MEKMKDIVEYQKRWAVSEWMFLFAATSSAGLSWLLNGPLLLLLSHALHMYKPSETGDW